MLENVPIRMRVIYASQRIEFTTGYRIDVAQWDADKQKIMPTTQQLKDAFNLHYSESNTYHNGKIIFEFER